MGGKIFTSLGKTLFFFQFAPSRQGSENCSINVEFSFEFMS